MRITLNSLPLELKQQMTLAELLSEYHHSILGTALAVNQVIIPRGQWADYWLKDGDDILLFQAIAGG